MVMSCERVRTVEKNYRKDKKNPENNRKTKGLYARNKNKIMN
jgi:hypothetical protein